MLRLTAVFAAGLALAGAVDVGGINMNTGVNTGKYTVKIQNTNIGKIKYKNTKYSVGGINMNAGVNTVRNAKPLYSSYLPFGLSL